MWHRISSSSVIESQLRLVLLSIQGIKYHHQSFKFIGHICMASLKYNSFQLKSRSKKYASQP